jgi:hypothetical protein
MVSAWLCDKCLMVLMRSEAMCVTCIDLLKNNKPLVCLPFHHDFSAVSPAWRSCDQKSSRLELKKYKSHYDCMHAVRVT